MGNNTRTTDQPVLAHIQELVEEEHRLFGQGEHGTLADADREKLTSVQVELDRCWDLLRQRRALRQAGQDPDMAQVRSAQVVENYEQ
ncbi:MAG TPA: DUF2630 family protein [Nitrospira sp.]|jgi:hypothetical protein